MDSIECEETQARVAADRLIADIRSGALRPGHKLRVGELKEKYGIGSSPLREALLLVTSHGYATGESHRGYRVAAMSAEDLADITLAREVVECGMLRESMRGRTDEWTVGIVAALERLRLVAAKSEASGTGEFTAAGIAHKQFHTALVAGCSSTRLANVQNLLYDQAGRYREIMVKGFTGQTLFVQTHAELAQVVLSGDVEAACQALCVHLNLTPRDVYGADIGLDRSRA
jgi:GntR family carbon starvation induced transcriptional regulator